MEMLNSIFEIKAGLGWAGEDWAGLGRLPGVCRSPSPVLEHGAGDCFLSPLDMDKWTLLQRRMKMVW